MIEELAAYILGVDVDEKWDELDDLLIERYDVDMGILNRLVKELLPLIEVAKSPLTGTIFAGFAAREKGLWLMKVEVEQGEE